MRAPVVAGEAIPDPVERRDVSKVGRDPEGELEVRRLVEGAPPGVGEGADELVGRLGLEVERGEDRPE